MRVVLFLCACVCVVAGQNYNDAANLPKYDTRYDYLDLDALFYSKRLVRNYVDCLINAQRCTPEGKHLKRVLPEALRTKCVRCTERQKKTAVKVIRRLKEEFPEEWAKLAARWDPTGDFTRYFEVYLANEQLNTISGSGGSNDIAGPSSIPPTRPVSSLRPIPQLPSAAPRPMSQPSAPPRPVSLPPVPPRSPVVPSNPPVTPTDDPVLVLRPVPASTPPRPILVNRFGEDGELMVGSPSSAAATPRTTTPAGVSTTPRLVPTSAFLRYLHRLLHECIAGQGTHSPYSMRPTNWVGAGSQENPTRYPLRPTKDIPPPYTTTITFIDRIGYKIIRTTELVTDILKSTVRAVVGR